MAQKTSLHHRPLHRSWSSKPTPAAFECRVQRAAGRRDARPQTARGNSATCRARPCRTPRPRRRTPPGSTAPSCCPAVAQHHLIIHDGPGRVVSMPFCTSRGYTPPKLATSALYSSESRTCLLTNTPGLPCEAWRQPGTLRGSEPASLCRPRRRRRAARCACAGAGARTK